MPCETNCRNNRFVQGVPLQPEPWIISASGWENKMDSHHGSKVQLKKNEIGNILDVFILAMAREFWLGFGGEMVQKVNRVVGLLGLRKKQSFHKMAPPEPLFAIGKVDHSPLLWPEVNWCLVRDCHPTRTLAEAGESHHSVSTGAKAICPRNVPFGTTTSLLLQLLAFKTLSGVGLKSDPPACLSANKRAICGACSYPVGLKRATPNFLGTLPEPRKGQWLHC